LQSESPAYKKSVLDTLLTFRLLKAKNTFLSADLFDYHSYLHAHDLIEDAVDKVTFTYDPSLSIADQIQREKLRQQQQKP
jgi:hypothetical protein